tara:strand:- start:847 stop:1932 length:1086 start_codon:yes stop_codon:yes gene_type:complete
MAQTPKEFLASVASNGPLLTSLKRDMSTGGELHTTYDQEVSRETVPVALAFKTLSSKIYNERNSSRARISITETDNFQERCSETNKPTEFLCNVTTCKSTVATGTAVTAASLYLISSTVKDIDGVHAEKIDVVATSYPTLVSKVIHPELKLTITTTKELVAAGTALPADAAGTTVTIDDIDCAKALKTTQTIADWAALALDLCEEVNYTFPSILASFTSSSQFLRQKRRSVFFLAANRRNSFKELVTAKVSVSLHSTKAAAVAAQGTRLSIIPNNLIYSGVLFNVNEQGVLNDTGTLVATTNSRDVYYGYGSETYSYTASVPTATAYAALVSGGAYQQVGYTIKPWQFNLWRLERVFIVMK